MNYSAYKVHVRHPFVRHNKLRYLHAAIRFFCGTYTDHNGSKVLGEDGVWYMYEAVGAGTVRVTWDEWMSQEVSIQAFKNHKPKLPYRMYILEPVETTDRYLAEIRGRAEQFLDRKYDRQNTLLQQLWYFFTRWATGRGRWIGKTQKWSEDEFECSELMRAIYGEPQAYMAHPTE
jgi:hypothetical protein